MVIGITGGVGSGKTTVLKMLKQDYCAKIHIADEYGHEAYMPGNPCYQMIVGMFGKKIVGVDGEINREILSKEVYSEPRKLEMLNRIIHPYVWERIEQEIKKDGEEDLIVIESAILIEAGYQDICDKIWGVFCQKEERIKRLIKARGYTREKAERIMKRQMSEWELRRRCDAVIENDGNVEYLKEQLEKLLGTE